MSILTSIGDIPAAGPDAIADDDLIGAAVWAHLQGVKLTTFHPELYKSRVRRRHDAEHPGEPPQARPGDIPEPDDRVGREPLWRMATYREWEKRRPGQASSRGKAGRPRVPGRPGGTEAGAAAD